MIVHLLYDAIEVLLSTPGICYVWRLSIKGSSPVWKSLLGQPVIVNSIRSRRHLQLSCLSTFLRACFSDPLSWHQYFPSILCFAQPDTHIWKMSESTDNRLWVCDSWGSKHNLRSVILSAEKLFCSKFSTPYWRDFSEHLQLGLYPKRIRSRSRKLCSPIVILVSGLCSRYDSTPVASIPFVIENNFN